MMGKVKLTIRGVRTGPGPEDVSELVTTAEYYDNGVMKYLFYTEYTEDGQLQKNRLTIAPEYIELKKTGDATSVLTFREGVKKPCIYQTPAGPMEFISDTRRINLRESEDTLTLRMEYSLLLNGELVSDHRLTVDARLLMQA